MQLHPLDAARFGSTFGDLAEVASAAARIVVRLEITRHRRAGPGVRADALGQRVREHRARRCTLIAGRRRPDLGPARAQARARACAPLRAEVVRLRAVARAARSCRRRRIAPCRAAQGTGATSSPARSCRRRGPSGPTACSAHAPRASSSPTSAGGRYRGAQRRRRRAASVRVRRDREIAAVAHLARDAVRLADARATPIASRSSRGARRKARSRPARRLLVLRGRPLDAAACDSRRRARVRRADRQGAARRNELRLVHSGAQGIARRVGRERRYAGLAVPNGMSRRCVRATHRCGMPRTPRRRVGTRFESSVCVYGNGCDDRGSRVSRVIPGPNVPDMNAHARLLGFCATLRKAQRSRLCTKSNTLRGDSSCQRSRDALFARACPSLMARSSRRSSPWPSQRLWRFRPSVCRPHARKKPAQPLEEVVVTGSRIVRRDYEANSPLQTLDRSAFEQQNSIGLETALNELPQFVPAAQGVTQLQDQSQMTDNFTTLTAGASTVSLRGLGANRNLVLVDGYRAVPVNATMAVDVNSIPAAAIERVEVITGGASSVYGADAVAGVVNFILKRDFEGLDLDVQTGSMQNGAGNESRASALFGVNSGDGRGNIMLGLELAKRDAVHADDTDFWHDALRDGTTYPTQLIYTGPYYTTDGANAPLRSHRGWDIQPGAGRHHAEPRQPHSRGRRRQFLLERRRLALHRRRVVQQQHVRRRHLRRLPLQRPDVHLARQRDRSRRLSVPLRQRGGHDHSAHLAVRGEHPARSQLHVRPCRRTTCRTQSARTRRFCPSHRRRGAISPTRRQSAAGASLRSTATAFMRRR